MRSVIVDGPDSWSQTLVKEGIVERFIGLDFSDAETVFDRSLEAIKKAQSVRSPSCSAPGNLGPRLCGLHAHSADCCHEQPCNLLTTAICKTSLCHLCAKRPGIGPVW